MKAEKYAQSVVDGKIPAPKYVKIQCQKFLDVLNGKNEKYIFDYEKAKQIEKILKILIMPRGLKAGSSIYDCSCGYQWLFYFSILCIVYKDNKDKRKYETAILEIGRKNFKTFTIATIFILLFLLEPKFSKFYSVAPDGALSREVKTAIEEILKSSPKIYLKKERQRFKILRDYIQFDANENRYIPLNYSNSRMDGKLPNVFLADEVGALPNSYAIESMRSGQLNILNKLGCIANKFLNPDGSIHTLDEISGDGSGDGTTVLQERGQSTADVMSQKATSDMLFDFSANAPSSNIKIASNSNLGSAANVNTIRILSNNGVNAVYPVHNNSVFIGGVPTSSSAQNATQVGFNTNSVITGAGNSSSSFGYGANASGMGACTMGYCASGSSSYAVAAGYNSAGGYFGTGLGTQARGVYDYSVALGSYSKTDENSVVSVGDGSANVNYGTRRIVNVKNPVNAQDAATKNYVDVRVPAPPANCTFTLQCENGVTSWISV